jgi:SAM-dependent methyltransferase
MQLTYHPAVFHVNDIPQAMSVIMTPEGSTTEERWQIETPYLADLIAQQVTITPDTLLLDYGCGIGRLAFELIQRHNCRVVGVDISPSMRALSVIYTRSNRFLSCSHEMLEGLVARGMRFDAALSLWVLQHCATPAEDIARIRNALKPEGQLFVVNGVFRSVPTLESGWVNDGLDVKAMLMSQFPLVHEGKLAREKTTESLAAHAFWASYRAS